MATTHTLSDSFSSPQLNAPPPSQNPIASHQIPDVFVIPPEEEQEDNPPWLAYDATEAKVGLATSPDIDAVDIALGLFQQTDNRAPAFHRYHSNESQETIIMPKRSSSRASIGITSDALEASSSNRRGIDEDVVEVIKVRRNEGMEDVSDGKMKKSRTFRARATQAFRSIKNVAKTNRKAVTEVWPGSSESENIDCTQGEPMAETSYPNLSRRKSATLSQLFGATRGRGPIPHPEPPSGRSSSSERGLPSSRPSTSSLSDKTNMPATSKESEESNNPSLTKRKSFRNRISVLDLQRLFNPSSSGASSAMTPKASQENLPSSSGASRHESLPLFLSSSSDHNPGSADDLFVSQCPTSQRHSFSTADTRSSLALSKSSSNTSSILRREFNQDIILENSFEMRLDSLHFDSLHFDPDEFDPNEYQL